MMDSNMETFLNNIDIEHESLIDRATSLENEALRLSDENSQLQKALDKQKLFHRNYAIEVAAMEKINYQEFREEKRSLSEENKKLKKAYRQSQIDVNFYKKAYAELAKESGPADTTQLSGSNTNNSNVSVSPPPPPPVPVRSTPPRRVKKMTKSASTAASEPHTMAYLSPSCKCTHTSSKVITKVNEKLFDENKKLKSKLSNLNTTIAMLKKTNKQHENFRNKMDKKKLKFLQDSTELNELVASTKKTNKYTFDAQALAMLRELIQ